MRSNVFFAEFFKIEKNILPLSSNLSVMANIKSSIKDIRKSQARKEHNRYYAKTTRNIIKKIRLAKDKKTAQELLPTAYSMLDKLAKRNIIHRNKAANLKSKITTLVNSIQ